MIERKTQRLRDPVHGLIVFRDDRDLMAWDLLGTPEFQRLRRTKQLGVSEFVFPGATHTRFAHSIGVFHTARQLVEILAREINETLDQRRVDIAIIAAMLHDVGHGPFSHAFEGIQKTHKKHEKWSAEIIKDQNGGIHRVLSAFGERFHGDGDAFVKEVADLIEADVPRDIYHAVVSSSFDADRLDYLRRDRMMTGSGAGAIDFDWLMDNLRVATIDFNAAEDDKEPTEIPGFCFHHKALQAAETFLLARYHLYTQVYLHKATRGIEQMLAALFRRASSLVDEDKIGDIGLAGDHPLIQFLLPDGSTLTNYLALDDFTMWGAVEAMSRASDDFLRDMSIRLRSRNLYKSLDVEVVAGPDTQDQRMFMRRLETKFADEMGKTVLKDMTDLSIYGEVGIDDDKMHKRLMILDGSNKSHEITGVSATIRSLEKKRTFVRYYFASDSQRDLAKSLGGGQK